jgi:hypothetical protein
MSPGKNLDIPTRLRLCSRDANCFSMRSRMRIEESRYTFLSVPTWAAQHPSESNQPDSRFRLKQQF